LKAHRSSRKLPDYIPQNRIHVSPQQYEELLGNYRLIDEDRQGRTILSDDLFTMSLGEGYLELLNHEFGIITQPKFKRKTLLYSVDAEVRIIRNSDNHLESLIFTNTLFGWKLLKAE
jgi:hypothetical protein